MGVLLFFLFFSQQNRTFQVIYIQQVTALTFMSLNFFFFHEILLYELARINSYLQRIFADMVRPHILLQTHPLLLHGPQADNKGFIWNLLNFVSTPGLWHISWETSNQHSSTFRLVNVWSVCKPLCRHLPNPASHLAQQTRPTLTSHSHHAPVSVVDSAPKGPQRCGRDWA